MPHLALIGYPLSHSFSKKYFEEKFSQLGLLDWRYELWPMEDLNLLKERIKHQKDLRGFNVTIPHKTNIIPLCNRLSEEAANIGAVNCVAVTRHDEEVFLTGHNTDAYGFEKSLNGWYRPSLNKAIIFGDGGSAKAVKFVLNKHNISYVQVVRNVSHNQQMRMDQLNRDLLVANDLIINCTPIGMFPDNNAALPLDTAWIEPCHQFYDLVYNPAETATMQLFQKHGASVKNGLEMLHLQADKAWEIWLKK